MVTELRCKYLSSVFQILIYNLSFNHNLHSKSRFTHADVDSIRCVRGPGTAQCLRYQHHNL